MLRTLALLIHAYENDRDNGRAAAHAETFSRLSIVADDQEYSLLYGASPDYPTEDINSATVGAVELAFTIDRVGRTRDLVVVDSAGTAAMVEAAREAVARYRYLPRVVNGEPVAVEETRMMVMFSLSN